MKMIFDEYKTRKLPLEERFRIVESKLKAKGDESIRWDCVWLAGEITDGMDPSHPLFSKVADLLTYVMKNDDNGIVRHEASFQIGARNMRNKIPDLVESAFHDDNAIVRHESIEALGLIRAFEHIDDLKKMAKSESVSDRETAKFVLKRLARIRGADYKVLPVV